jgi:acyl carrier protein
MDIQPDLLTGQVLAMVAEALQAPPEAVTETLSFGDLPEWDSMGHMEVMVLLEERFGVEISADTIAELTSIETICNYLKENSHA